MLSALKWLLYGLIAAALAVLVGAQYGLLRGTPPGDLGARNGKLKPPSPTPNSVSSQADLWPGHPQRDYARIAPLPLRGDGPNTLADLRRLCEGMPGASVVSGRSDYLHVQFETRVLKFVDDVEFWFDPKAGVVQIRSASRLGRKDFGVNRARIEHIRKRLAAF